MKFTNLFKHNKPNKKTLFKLKTGSCALFLKLLFANSFKPFQKPIRNLKILLYETNFKLFEQI